MPEPSAPNPIGSPFIELQSVDSTNNYALGLVHAGLAQHGMAVFAQEQSAGKGQWGRVWTSEAGSNLILSIVIKPAALQVSEQFRLSAAAALAAHEFFMNYAGNETHIKWPNDLYWQDRKAGGILIESVVSSQSAVASRQLTVGSQQSAVSSWQWAVVGIGININQTSFPSELQNPVSLKQITGRSFHTVDLAHELCGLIEKYYLQLIRDGFDPIYENYNAALYKKNEKVKLKKDTRVFEATIRRITPFGKLIVEHSIEEEFDFGEIEWMIK